MFADVIVAARMFAPGASYASNKLSLSIHRACDTWYLVKFLPRSESESLMLMKLISLTDIPLHAVMQMSDTRTENYLSTSHNILRC